MITLPRLASSLALASLALVGHAQTVDAYSNLGSPASYVASNVRGGYILSQDALADLNFAVGFQFLSTATGTLDSFQAAINQGDENRDFSLSLYADSGSDTLGTLLGTYGGTSTGVDASTATTALATVPAVVPAGGAPVSLAGGAKYWLVASVPTTRLFDDLVWNRSNAAAASPTVFSLTGRAVGGQRTTYGSDTPAAFSVRVIPAPVPEPASMAALGLGALAMLRRRKRA